jgi:recombination protein RecT
MSEEEKSKEVIVGEFLEKVENKFESAPMGIVFEREKGFALQAFRANDFLMKVALENPVSLLAAMTNVASIGLSLNPAKKQAYLVPRKGVVCLDPSYMGLCDLATQSGAIEFVQAKIVRAEDTYENQGVDKEPLHKYQAFSKERGEIVGVYCTAKTSKGDYLTTEMSIEKVNEIRDRSDYYKKKQAGPWVTDYEEMAKKTVIRNAFKTWPKTETLDRLAMAIDLSNQNEGFEQLRRT